MANFFKNKNFWLTLAHVGTAAGSLALTVFFPAAIPAIIPIQALINGLIPSPLNPPSVVINPPSSVPNTSVGLQQADSITGSGGLIQSNTFVENKGGIGLSIGDEMKMQDKVK